MSEIKIERIPTGIKGLDDLIEGGLPKGSTTLISGPPGTGKSIFCMNFLYNNAAKYGRKGLYVSFEQSEKEIKIQMSQLGLDHEIVEKGLIKILTQRPENPDLVFEIMKEAGKGGFELVVIDSLASIVTSPMSPERQLSMSQIQDAIIPLPMDVENLNRIKVKMIMEAVKGAGVTSLLTTEMVDGMNGYSRDTISEFLADAVIVLHHVEGEEGFRTLHIPKIRLTKQKSGIYNFEITKKGIEVKTQE